MPVIQPRALHPLIVDRKSERFYQVQHAPGRRTGTGDVARILRDLRLDQNYIEHIFSSFFKASSILCESGSLFKVFPVILAKK